MDLCEKGVRKDLGGVGEWGNCNQNVMYKKAIFNKKTEYKMKIKMNS